MVVNVVECLSGAQRAQGVVVMVDVFQAYTVACHALAKDPERLLVVDSLEKAQELCRENDAVLIGEAGGTIADGAEFANSPTGLADADLAGKTVVMATDAGTRALFASPLAGEILACGFVNAKAVVDYVLDRKPEMVTMVAVGTNGDMRAQEDMMCAIYVKNELEDYPNSFDTLKTFLAQVDSSEKFFDETRADVPENDYEMCMELDRFDFAVRAVRQEEGVMLLEKGAAA